MDGAAAGARGVVSQREMHTELKGLSFLENLDSGSVKGQRT